MDCNIIEEKLLDYIDDKLNKEEEKKIKEHLKVCQNCSKEYDEIKSTINHIKDNSNKIDTSKKLNLNPNKVKKKSIRRFTRTGLIAVALSLMLVVTAFATDIFDFIKYWEKSSEREISAWEELIENGVGQELDISVTDKDIKVTAEGIIADDLNTIILLRIEDLDGNIRFTPSTRDGSYGRSLSVGGDIPNWHEDIPPIANYYTLYAEEENTVRLMVKTKPMDKDKGNVEVYLNKMMSFINESEESIVEISGNWDMTIPAKKIASKVYDVDEIIDLDGNELIIDKITIAPTATRIHYGFEGYNEENRYFIDSLSFIIKDGMKTYGRSELSSISDGYTGGFGFTNREFDIESLYLEDPKDIDIIVNTYRYTTRGREKYDIDWDNLPQVIEYDNSKITIEDIKYDEDSTEIIIKEDSSWNRKYIDSNIYLMIDEIINEEYDGTQYSHRMDNKFNGIPTEYETRDSKGRVKDEENEFWTDEFHNFVFRQKITLSKEQFEIYEMNEDNYDEYLIPGELYIEGQRYIEYPNIKRNIKLRQQGRFSLSQLF